MEACKSLNFGSREIYFSAIRGEINFPTTKFGRYMLIFYLFLQFKFCDFNNKFYLDAVFKCIIA
jgi:hypothetical protein